MSQHALVLSGGGAHGAWQLGYAEGLVQALGSEFEPDHYVGTSVGGLMAAAMAQERTFAKGVARYGALWDRIEGNKSIYKTWWPRWLGPLAYIPSLWKGSVYKASPLRSLLRENFNANELVGDAAGLVRIEGAKRLTIATVDLRSTDLVYYTERTIHDWRPVYATAAYPLAFEPIKLADGSLATDGGLREVTPLARAIDAGARHIDVIMVQPDLPNLANWPDRGGFMGLLRLFNRADRMVGTLVNEVIKNDIRRCLKINAKVRSGVDTEHEYVSLRVHRPKASLSGSSLDFDPKHWRKNRETGRQEALQWARTLNG